MSYNPEGLSSQSNYLQMLFNEDTQSDVIVQIKKREKLLVTVAIVCVPAKIYVFQV